MHRLRDRRPGQRPRIVQPTISSRSELNTGQQLAVISRAWGKQTGFCFFPWIKGGASNREERIKSYNEGPAFMWPRDKAKILEHMSSHTNDDLYWCPSLFEKPQRKMELAMDEHCLWADLDEVDPRDIPDYPPTIAWQTSPGRFQALWLITGGLMGASWMGNENQRLTYYLGADVSGWDTTQLLRIPEWTNHKFEYWDGDDTAVQGELLWKNGRRYLPDDFKDLPETKNAAPIDNVLDEEIDRVDRHEVWGRVRLKVTKRVRELMSAKEASGDRSEVAWSIERDLADAGCSPVEIVAIIRPSVWNKYDGRQDELKRLTIEASRAYEMREAKSDELEVVDEKPPVTDLWAQLAAVKQPEWLINGVLTVGACGFIAGQPKNFKSWVALDMALSVATGLPFLDHFAVRQPGPVLFIQEEDSAPMVKSRVQAVWPSKIMDKVKMGADGELEWHPPDEADHPKINAAIRSGVIISDPGWQSWMDEQISAGYEGIPYQLVVIDPLMMVAGEVDENRAQEMTTKVFRPLKVLAEKHKCAIIVVHHMRKGDPKTGGSRGGQLMLGSMANHAWAEDALYLRFGRGGDVYVERESKNAMGGTFVIKGLRRRGWSPVVMDDKTDVEAEGDAPVETAKTKPRAKRPPRTPRASSKALEALRTLPRGSGTAEVAISAGITSSGAYRQLVRDERAGRVVHIGHKWYLPKK